MSNNLRIIIMIFSICLLFIILRLISNRKLPIRYSLFWILASILLFFVGVFPDVVYSLTDLFGFIATSNFVIGILLAILLVITLMLTLIVSNQKRQIKQLIQDLSILKAEYNGECKNDK